MLKERIEKLIDDKMKNEGIMGTEQVTISLKLTDEEKEEFLNIDWEENYDWEFEGNELYVIYHEELKGDEEMDLSKIYAEWREVTEENADVGEGTTTDAGEGIAREDFSDYAGLEEEMNFEEMLRLEREYEG